MDFIITPEQIKIRDEIILFAQKNLNRESEFDSFARATWKKAAEFGLFGISVPEKYGGLGESYLTAAIVSEALGYACKNNGFVFTMNNHIWVSLNLILLFGSDYLKDRYIRKMVNGEWIGAMCISEADAGSDAKAIRTSAKLTENGYVLNGTKTFVSNGAVADVFIVFAKCYIAGKELIGAFVVEKNIQGVNVGKEIQKMGLNSCSMTEVYFDNCKIPIKNVLGVIEAGENIMKSALEWERCFEFACHIGAMRRIMEFCITYIRQRKQFGCHLIEYQAITHKIADMRVKIELGRLLLWKIAWKKDQRKSAYLDAAIFKLFVSESYIQTCRDAMQIFGAYGYSKEYPLERELRDALASSIYSGTNEIQRNTIFTLSSFDFN